MNYAVDLQVGVVEGLRSTTSLRAVNSRAEML